MSTVYSLKKKLSFKYASKKRMIFIVFQFEGTKPFFIVTQKTIEIKAFSLTTHATDFKPIITKKN